MREYDNLVVPNNPYTAIYQAVCNVIDSNPTIHDTIKNRLHRFDRKTNLTSEMMRKQVADSTCLAVTHRAFQSDKQVDFCNQIQTILMDIVISNDAGVRLDEGDLIVWKLKEECLHGYEHEEIHYFDKLQNQEYEVCCRNWKYSDTPVLGISNSYVAFSAWQWKMTLSTQFKVNKCINH